MPASGCKCTKAKSRVSLLAAVKHCLRHQAQYSTKPVCYTEAAMGCPDADAPQITPVICTNGHDSVLSLASSATQDLRPGEPHSLMSSPSPLGGPIFSHPESPALEAAREYEQLMDSHSLHEFLMRYGHTLSSTPEFASYRRVYAAVWPVIEELIKQLEGICTEYAVPLAVVDGKVSSTLLQ